MNMNEMPLRDDSDRSWIGRHWMWAVPIGCLGSVVVCAGLVTLLIAIVFGALKSSDAYTQSLAMVRGDERVRAALGAPLEPDTFVSGNIHVSGSSGRADLSYGVTGPLGEGTVSVGADKIDGKWEFRSVVVEIDQTGQRIDVLAGP